MVAHMQARADDTPEAARAADRAQGGARAQGLRVQRARRRARAALRVDRGRTGRHARAGVHARPRALLPPDDLARRAAAALLGRRGRAQGLHPRPGRQGPLHAADRDLGRRLGERGANASPTDPRDRARRARDRPRPRVHRPLRRLGARARGAARTAACSSVPTRTWPGAPTRSSTTPKPRSRRCCRPCSIALRCWHDRAARIRLPARRRLGERAARRRGRRGRRRRRRLRPAGRALLPLAGQRRDPAREGRDPRRHGQQGRLLVLGPEQRPHGRRPRGRLPALLRAAVRAGALRPRQPDAGHGRLGVRGDEGDLRLRLARGRAAGREGRAALPPLRGGAGLLVRAARGRGADRPRLRPPRRARHDVRRRAERHPHAERRGRARRRRHPHRAPRPAAADQRRRGRRRRRHRAARTVSACAPARP